MASHWPRAPRTRRALGIGLACLLTTPHGAQAHEESAIARAVPPSTRLGDEIMLVGLLDGSLHALDPTNGQQLWEFSTGAPLVTSHTQDSLVSATSDAPDFFPGVDGRLYHISEDDRSLERLPFSVQDLVAQSPSMTGHGAPVLGSRHTAVHYLDRRSGRLHSTVTTDARGRPPPPSQARIEALQEVDASSVLAVARVQHEVEALNPLTGAVLWNVSHAAWRHLPLPGLRDASVPLLDVSTGMTDMTVPREASAMLGLPYGEAPDFRMPDEATVSRFHTPDDLVAVTDDGVPVEPAEPRLAWSHIFRAPAVFIALCGDAAYEDRPPSARHPALAADAPPPPLPPPRWVVSDSGEVVEREDGDAEPAYGSGTDGQPLALAPAGGVAAAAAAGERRAAARPVAVGRLGGSLYVMPVSKAKAAKSRKTASYVPRAGRAAARQASLEEVAAGGKRALVASGLREERGHSDGFMCPIGVMEAPDIDHADVPYWLPQNTGAAARLDQPASTKGTHAQGTARHLQGPRSMLRPLNVVLAALIAVLLLAMGWLGWIMQRHPPVHAATGGAALQALDGGGGGEDAAPLSRERRASDGSLRIGELHVSTTVLGHGSSTHGTTVFEGSLSGRQVAVKRMLMQFHEVARKEFDALVASDEHANVLRCFAWERSDPWVYLALERCDLTLYDAFTQPDPHGRFPQPGDPPTELTLSIALGCIRGVEALHRKDIVHRDLKPQNILLTKDLHAKVSDMGLSKQIAPSQTSFDSYGGGGSSGWQAPEQITCTCDESGMMRQSKAVDIFSLALVLFWTLSNGEHAFGKRAFERDGRIVSGAPDLSPLDALPDVQNLLAAMLDRDPKRRPSIATVARHPCWWPRRTKLQFLIDTSDAFELCDRAADSTVLRALEATAASAFPPGANWAASLEKDLIANLYAYRSYRYSSTRDLLRVVRNKCNHFREMPPALQALIGAPPNAYYDFFAARFPRLLLTMFFFVLRTNSHTEALFEKYDLQGEALCFASCADVHAGRAAAAAAAAQPPRPPPVVDPADGGEASNQSSRNSAAHAEAERAASAVSLGSSSAGMGSAPALTTFVPSASLGSADELGRASAGTLPPAAEQSSAENGAGAAAAASPERGLGPGGAISAATLKNRRRRQQRALKEGVATAAAPHLSPPRPPIPPPHPPPAAPLFQQPALNDFSHTPLLPPFGRPPPPPPPAAQIQVGWQRSPSTAHTLESFPQNPGQEVCAFFVSTGTCKYGARCFKHHPDEYCVPLNARGLPMRDGEQECPFYMQTATCKYGKACKFHHPNLDPMYAGAELRL